MRTLRPDRVVRMLAALTSFAYFFLLAGGALVLIGLPLIWLSGVGGFHYGLELPVATPDLETMVQTVWGPVPLELELDDVRGKLRLPIAVMPWWLLAGLWAYAAVGGALILLFLQNLRRIFQRVRDGAAFDALNVVRLRTLGVLLVMLAVLSGVAQTATSMAVRRGLTTGSTLTVPAGIHMDMSLVLVGLVLMALAEVFRRGAELEHEQSLVV